MAKTFIRINNDPRTVEAVEIPLPTWTDPTSIAVTLTAVIAAVNGVLAATNTGYQLPPLAEALVPIVSFAVAGAVVALNVWRHTKATIAAISR
jgi:hypothetical protein